LVETAHHSTIPGHPCLIAMVVGRKIEDAESEQIVGDPMRMFCLRGLIVRPGSSRAAVFTY
jgi:hypothetical protein